MRKVRIVMNGMPNGTRVYDSETGVELTQVSSIEIVQKVGEPPVATIVLRRYVELTGSLPTVGNSQT